MIKFFTAEWCTACKTMKRTLGNEIDTLTIVDADNEPDQVISYSIRSIPTFIKIVDGEEVSRKVGSMSKETFLAWVNE